jgi:phosphatidylinositol alpha-1,6-mannosyltransferase
MIGRIVKRKGFDQFVEVIGSVPNTSGIIVGSGPYEDTLKTLIAEKHLQNRIKCLPFQPQEKLPDIYSSIDAFFLFSEREGLPLSLLEAQSVGVPYIGNSVGGIGEVVKDSYNGFIIDKIDFEEINDRINKIEENAIYYRSNARKVVEEKYSLDKTIISIEKLYMESLKAG